jgi:hypothetical protein|tara:strand:+ start:3407 stop:3517 length:111 start_codon:yes stop_codon:yes gene_type:complete
MEEDKKTVMTIGWFFVGIGIVVVLELILSVYLQAIY